MQKWFHVKLSPKIDLGANDGYECFGNYFQTFTDITPTELACSQMFLALYKVTKTEQLNCILMKVDFLFEEFRSLEVFVLSW